MSFSLVLKRLLVGCFVLTLTGLAHAANGPSPGPGKSAAMPTPVVTGDNQHLFNAARTRLFDIAQRADTEYHDRLKKSQSEWLRSLRTRLKKDSARLSIDPCETCVADAVAIDCENCDENATPLVTRQLPDSQLLACENCGISAPQVVDSVSLTDGALTFDALPIDVTESSDAAAKDDEGLSENSDAADNAVRAIPRPTSSEPLRVAAENAITQFASAVKSFSQWLEVRVARNELRIELAALEEEVASLQARIDNLKRLAAE